MLYRALLASAVVLALTATAATAAAQPPAASGPRPQPFPINWSRVNDYVAPAFVERSTGHPFELVIVRVDVGADGRVIDVVAVAGLIDQVAAARDALRQWTFTPPGGDGAQWFVGFNPRARQTKPGAPLGSPSGERTAPPRKVRDVKPRYPAEAQRKRVQGIITTESLIDGNGVVAYSRVTRGDPRLAVAALEAVLQWQFTPPGVPLTMTTTTNFSLQVP